MKILWVSDSPTTPSGFGGVTREVCRRLARRGHALEIIGWQTHGATAYWEGVPVRPLRRDQFGADVLLSYLMRMRPDFVVTLADVWWMSFMTEPSVQRYFDQSGTRWAHYYPIDGADPDGRLPEGWRRVLRTVDVPIAMSQFGAQVSAACGIGAHYIPHGCDTELFAPPTDKEAAKARLGYDGRFVVLSDARNQPRKLLPRTLDIFAAFAADKPDAVLHLHCDPQDAAARSELYCYDLLADVAASGISQQVRFTEGFRMRASGGVSLTTLAGVYAAADVHLLSSWGEGFGLPNLQAASAGVVPIAVAYSASYELVAGHGRAIDAESAVLDEFGLVRCLMRRETTVEALETLYEDGEARGRAAAASRAFALAYAWDPIVDEWERVLKNAPPRRKPERARHLDWVAGTKNDVRQLPAPVASAALEAFAGLPLGAALSIDISERRQGEVGAQIRREAFVLGDELSIPVRLPPAFAGAPRAQVGHVMVAPDDLPTAVLLRRVFPGISVAVPRPNGDPTSREFVSMDVLAPALLHCSLVLDASGGCGMHVDAACAVLGTSYLGTSSLWPLVGTGSAFGDARRLLTDHGFAEWRRVRAFERARELFGDDAITQLRELALRGQPNQSVAPGPPVPEPDLFFVRLHDDAPAPARGSVANFVTARGGYVLLATRGTSLIVAMPPKSKTALEALPHVAFVGAVNLDPAGKASSALRRRFAANVKAQQAARVATAAHLATHGGGAEAQHASR